MVVKLDRLQQLKRKPGFGADLRFGSIDKRTAGSWSDLRAREPAGPLLVLVGSGPASLPSVLNGRQYLETCRERPVQSLVAPIDGSISVTDCSGPQTSAVR